MDFSPLAPHRARPQSHPSNRMRKALRGVQDRLLADVFLIGKESLNMHAAAADTWRAGVNILAITN